MDNKTDHGVILNALLKVVPYLPQLFDNEVSISVANTEFFLVNLACESLPIRGKYGDPIPAGGAAQVAITTGNVVIKEVPAHIYGVPFRSYAVPVKNEDGTVAGVLLIAKSLERGKEVLKISEALSEAIRQITGAISSLTEDVQTMLNLNADIISTIKKASEDTKGTGDVLSFVQKVSSKTNLLGLNASIEASKAGNFGSGFNVIAQEIRKLSGTVSDSVKDIGDILKNITQSVQRVSDKMTEASTSFENQSAAIEEIAASMQELSSTAQILETMSREL